MKRARLDAGAYWRHLVNTIDRFVRGSDASLCQITLTRVTRRYASAGTSYVPVSVSVCLSVCLSVTSRFSNEKDARNNLVCAWRLLSTSPAMGFKKFRHLLQNKGTFLWNCFLNSGLENFATS